MLFSSAKLALAFCLAAAILPAQFGPRRGGIYGPRPGGRIAIQRTGKVALDTKSKDASVYVDGGLAGTAGKLKKFDLKPGKHTIEVRDAQGHSCNERVQVLQGKTVKIHCRLA